jgi:hypothetical protein
MVLEYILELHNVFVSKTAMNLDLGLKLEKNANIFNDFRS